MNQMFSMQKAAVTEGQEAINSSNRSWILNKAFPDNQMIVSRRQIYSCQQHSRLQKPKNLQQQKNTKSRKSCVLRNSSNENVTNLLIKRKGCTIWFLTRVKHKVKTKRVRPGAQSSPDDSNPWTSWDENWKD